MLDEVNTDILVSDCRSLTEAWNWIDIDQFGDNEIETFFLPRALHAVAIDRRLPVYSCSVTKDFIKSFDEIGQDLEKFSLYLMYKTSSPYAPDNGLFVGSLIYANVNNQYGNRGVSICGCNEKKVEALRNYFVSISAPDTKECNFFIISRSNNSYELDRLDIKLESFKEQNYTSDVGIAFTKLVSELSVEDPLGRITIINGEPGAGKTYLVRHLAYALPLQPFIILPPELTAYLTGPEGINIVKTACRASDGPVILVIEDADQILQRRMVDNIASISTLLNLCAGIIGDAFDVRIIATTNAKSIEIDSALRRPGRLSQKITIERLDYEQAKKCAESLGYTGILKEQTYTLADIYRLVKLQRSEVNE